MLTTVRSMRRWRNVQLLGPFCRSNMTVPASVNTFKAVQCHTESNQPFTCPKSSYYSPQDGFLNLLKPSFDSEYLNSVSHNLSSIQEIMKLRGISADLPMSDTQLALTQLAELVDKLDSLAKERDKLSRKIFKRKKRDNTELEKQLELIKQQLWETNARFRALQSQLMPFLMEIPIHIREDIQATPQLIEHFDGCPTQVEQSGAISHVRLGYINNIYHSSIIGPNAHYLLGEGAQLLHALNGYFLHLFEEAQYTPLNGLDFVKSPLVHAVNNRNVHEDQCRISYGQHDDNHNDKLRLHLVGEASLEAFCAWIAKLSPGHLISSKFVQAGSCYTEALSQQHCIRATVVSTDTESDQMMEQLYGIWWKALTQLQLKCRSVRSDIASLAPNEHAKYDLLVWLHSQRQWLPVAQVSHHSHYLTQRLGQPHFRSKHVLSSSTDLLRLFKCLIEHYQDTSTGKVKYATCLNNFLLSCE